MGEVKTAQTHRLSSDTLTKLRALSADFGVSQAVVVQLAIRDYWMKHGDEGMLQAQFERETSKAMVDFNKAANA